MQTMRSRAAALTLGRQRGLLHDGLRHREPRGGDRGGGGRLPGRPARRPPLEHAGAPGVAHGRELDDAGPEQHRRGGAHHPRLQSRPRRGGGRRGREPELVRRLDPHCRRLAHHRARTTPARARARSNQRASLAEHLHRRTSKIHREHRGSPRFHSMHHQHAALATAPPPTPRAAAAAANALYINASSREPKMRAPNRKAIKSNPRETRDRAAHQRQSSSYCQFSGAPPYHLPFRAESRAGGRVGGTPTRHQTTPPAARAAPGPGDDGRAAWRGRWWNGNGCRAAPAGERGRWWIPGERAPRKQGREEAERFAWGSEVIFGGTPATASVALLIILVRLTERGGWSR